jgi:hypothetical protein
MTETFCGNLHYMFYFSQNLQISGHSSLSYALCKAQTAQNAIIKLENQSGP